jgi:CRP/FNR family transcriptional regulator, cyclic AMP receptor protein
MDSRMLGRIYKDTEIIIKEGDQGNCMFVVLEGLVEIVKEMNGAEVLLALRGSGEFFGEMAIFEKEPRSATVRALGEARVLTIDKKNFMRRVHEDPSLAFNVVQVMSARIRELSSEVTRLQVKLDEVPRSQST